ncbi:MAG: terminase small subunit [Pseudomonadota bacterium]
MQQAFVAHYLVTLSAKKAAIAAGYAPGSADVQGYQLLQNPSVSKQLRKAMARRAKRLEVSAENVLREIARIAFSDIRAVMEFRGESVTFKDSDTLHSDAAAAIQSISSDTKTSGGGRMDSEPMTTVSLKIKMHDKMRALDLAGRHLGMWAKGEDDEFSKMTLVELVRLVRDKVPELEAKKET